MTAAPDDSVVFLVPGFPEDEGDTRCLPAVQNYVAACAARHPEWHVHVVAFHYPYRRGTYRWKGATVHALGGRNRRWPARLVTWAQAVAGVADVARRGRVRVVHSFWMGECCWLGVRLARRLGCPHVASIGGRDALADNPYLPRLDLADTVVTAGSAFAAETFFASTGRRVDAVVPLGLDVAALSAVPAPAVRDVDVVGVGALTPVKAYDTFVDLVGRLVPAFPRLRAVLVGDGPERVRLERRIRAAGLGGHVRLMGGLPRRAAYHTMLRSRILLHPAPYESQGYVFLEAALAGLHVVCRDVGYTGADTAAYRCRTESEMLDHLAHLLARQARPGPRRLVTVDDTVAAFDALYDALYDALGAPQPACRRRTALFL